MYNNDNDKRNNANRNAEEENKTNHKVNINVSKLPNTYSVPTTSPIIYRNHVSRRKMDTKFMSP